MTALHIDDVAKTFPGDPPIHALRSASMTVQAGERVAIIGSSGAGKSTLLNILGLLDEPTGGRYELLGQETRSLSARQRDRLRARHLGFVFQDAHALGARTCAENVALKLQILQIPRTERSAAVDEALEHVGLSHRTHSQSRLLSGGEKQRLAIARAIVGKPSILLADEPTGNLDGENAMNVLQLFDREASEGVTIVVITHDDRISTWADRTLQIDDGVLLAEGQS